MALKNLTGFVKMAIADNKNLDKETVDILCQYVDDLKVLIDSQDSLIVSLRELNNNQTKIIANNRTKRSDFDV